MRRGPADEAVDIDAHVNAHVYTQVYAHADAHVDTHVHTCICTQVECVCLFACRYTCPYTCLCTCMAHAALCVYTHVKTQVKCFSSTGGNLPLTSCLGDRWVSAPEASRTCTMRPCPCATSEILSLASEYSRTMLAHMSAHMCTHKCHVPPCAHTLACIHVCTHVYAQADTHMYPSRRRPWPCVTSENPIACTKVLLHHACTHVHT